MQCGAWFVERLIKHSFKKYYRYGCDKIIDYRGGLSLGHKLSKNAKLCMVC